MIYNSSNIYINSNICNNFMTHNIITNNVCTFPIIIITPVTFSCQFRIIKWINMEKINTKWQLHKHLLNLFHLEYFWFCIVIIYQIKLLMIKYLRLIPKHLDFFLLHDMNKRNNNKTVVQVILVVKILRSGSRLFSMPLPTILQTTSCRMVLRPPHLSKNNKFLLLRDKFVESFKNFHH